LGMRLIVGDGTPFGTLGRVGVNKRIYIRTTQTKPSNKMEARLKRNEGQDDKGPEKKKDLKLFKM